MWQFEHTITTKARAERIWKLYSNVATWPEWDDGIVHVSLDGPFIQGSRGLLQPEGQEPLLYELTHVDPVRGFSDVTHIPGAGIQIHFTHLLSEEGGETRITHKVTITGPKAEELGPIIGAEFAQGIPHAMENLASLALREERGPTDS